MAPLRLRTNDLVKEENQHIILIDSISQGAEEEVVGRTALGNHNNREEILIQCSKEMQYTVVVREITSDLMDIFDCA